MGERAAPEAAVDPDEVAKFALRVWEYKQGELVSLMIHLGDRLGLYHALDGAGPVGAAELARRTGLQERWLLEWLRSQAAARLLEYHPGDCFELTSVGRAVLADESESLAFAAGAFGEPTPPDVVAKLGEAFRTGVGLSYEDLGRSTAHRTDRMLAPWTRLALVPRILHALEGVVHKLEQGARVADVGCGAGAAVVALARAFPKSRFTGYDPSPSAIGLARDKVLAADLENVELRAAGGETLPAEPPLDFVLTLDCVHDMTRPGQVIAAIRRALHPDGTWLIKDIRSRPRFEDNRRNPLLALHYGFSVSTCMSSALAEPGGAGLGTLGFNPEVAERMCRSAGFTRFTLHDFDDPANLYYEVRP